MRVRTIIFWTLLSVLIALSWGVKAEEPPAPAPEDPPAPEDVVTRAEFEELARKLDSLRAAVESLTGSVTAWQRANSPPENELVGVSAAEEPAADGPNPEEPSAADLGTGEIKPAPDAPPAPSATVDVTRAEFEALAQLVYEQESAMGDIARRISEGTADKYVVDLRSAMALPQFREELSEAVHKVIRRRGTLRVENKSSVEYRLLVNGTEQRIPALRSVDIDVPVGTLITELLGYEAAKNWTIGAPDYLQGITITPAAPPVFVEPAVYVEWPTILY
jgi:hypothetical protein